MLIPFSIAVGCLLLGGAAAAQPAAPVPSGTPFTAHVIARDVAGGYQVIAADVNRDGKTDIIGLSQRGDLVWYENPDWTPHVILPEARARAMTGQDGWHMVNADAADLDGDGYPEIALAYGFHVDGPPSTGNIAILHQNKDGGWTVQEIGRVPTAHRVRFGDADGNGRKDLFVGPVLNEAETGGLALPHPLPVALWMFRADAAQRGGWRQSLITRENKGLVHAVQPLDWDGDGRDEILTAGFSGVYVHHLGKDGRWDRQRIAVGDTAPWPGGGASEVQVGRLAGRTFFVTIEHFHGTMVVVYTEDGRGGWHRRVIDDGLLQGHALVLADFDGDGRPEIVAGGNGSRANLFHYRPLDESGRNWKKTLIDDDISPSSCVAADIDGDARPDLVCMDGRKPNYIKWYGLAR